MSHVRFMAAVLTLGAAFPVVAHAADPDSSPCIVNPGHRVLAVEPYESDAGDRRITPLRRSGAQIYVEAEPGLTAEWLELKLQRQLGLLEGSPAATECGFDPSKVSVDVFSAGPGFWVRLSAPDSKEGKELFRQAQLLLIE